MRLERCFARCGRPPPQGPTTPAAPVTRQGTLKRCPYPEALVHQGAAGGTKANQSPETPHGPSDKDKPAPAEF
eukprot:1225761-Alexandrium_andersonii.AAC.1